MSKPYCVPLGAGLCSYPSSVGHRLGRLMTSLEQEINNAIVAPPEVNGALPSGTEDNILTDVAKLKRTMLERLRADGWRVDYLENHHRWRVLPPLRVRRR